MVNDKPDRMEEEVDPESELCSTKMTSVVDNQHMLSVRKENASSSILSCFVWFVSICKAPLNSGGGV